MQIMIENGLAANQKALATPRSETERIPTSQCPFSATTRSGRNARQSKAVEKVIRWKESD
eukprot:1867780-Rhodomonas_salina.2